MIKIVFTGPESSGKSILSSTISKKINAPLIKEYARDYLNKLNRDYKYSDLLKIAKGQLKLEEACINQKNKPKIMICDTNLQVIRIWSQIKYSRCDPFILENEDNKAYYVLCKPDFKWEYDPLRENKNNQMELFEYYHQDLIEKNRKFIIADGSRKKRVSVLEKQILKMM